MRKTGSAPQGAGLTSCLIFCQPKTAAQPQTDQLHIRWGTLKTEYSSYYINIMNVLYFYSLSEIFTFV